jgi:hypothetical protein
MEALFAMVWCVEGANIGIIWGEEEGIDGFYGVDGVDGFYGVDGVDGVNGVDGVDGFYGVDGVNGEDGRQKTKYPA